MASNEDSRLSMDDKLKMKMDKAMSDVVYAQNLFKEAFPERRYGSIKAMLNHAHLFISRRVRKEFTHRRARSIWEGQARRIDSEEMDALRLAVIEESRIEQRELRARLASLDAMLSSIDPSFDRSSAEEVRIQKGRLG